jgi:hypothetical protein
MKGENPSLDLAAKQAWSDKKSKNESPARNLPLWVTPINTVPLSSGVMRSPFDPQRAEAYV